MKINKIETDAQLLEALIKFGAITINEEKIIEFCIELCKEMTPIELSNLLKSPLFRSSSDKFYLVSNSN